MFKLFCWTWAGALVVAAIGIAGRVAPSEAAKPIDDDVQEILRLPIVARGYECDAIFDKPRYKGTDHYGRNKVRVVCLPHYKAFLYLVRNNDYLRADVVPIND